MFGIPANEYSYAHGKTVLFADLVDSARNALSDGDTEQMGRIAEYVTWAADKNSDELASVVDLAFFLPVVREPEFLRGLTPYFSSELLEAKRRLLLEDST